jgi:predicted regulator of Ras-like GTPase activity (Roadblock/LC7/MglB family)
MSFSEVLRELARDVKGARGAAIVGMDGIVVEQYVPEPGLDLQSLAAEYGNVVKVVQTASDSLSMGQARELAVVTEDSVMLIRKINEDYFMALVAEPGAAFGKGRFMVRKAVARVSKEF